MLVVADRPLLASYIDNAPVSFKFYTLKLKTDGLPGGPAYWFDLVETQTSKAVYCDVGVALSRELRLGDYRTSPRLDGYWNSPKAMSNNRSRGPLSSVASPRVREDRVVRVLASRTSQPPPARGRAAYLKHGATAQVSARETLPTCMRPHGPAPRAADAPISRPRC